MVAHDSSRSQQGNIKIQTELRRWHLSALPLEGSIATLASPWQSVRTRGPLGAIVWPLRGSFGPTMCAHIWSGAPPESTVTATI